MEHADELGGFTQRPTGLLLVILIAAGILRLFDLSASPLSPGEATEAWAAMGGDAAVSSGLVLGINRVLFWVFGAGDASARLFPALIGTALPLVAWLLAPVIGRRGALASAALLALSPSLVFFSRTVSGAMPGLVAALVWLAALWRHRDQGTDRWLMISAVALGAGLAAGPTFITTALLIMAASWLACPVDFFPLWRPFAVWRPWAVALAAALLGSTTLLAYPDGLGAVAGGLEAWLGGFALAEWWQPFARLAAYELCAVILGLLGLIYALRRGTPDHRLLAYWALGSLLLSLVRADQPDAALSALLPLSLLAATLLDRVLPAIGEPLSDRPALLAGGAVIAILAIHILVSLGQFAYRDSINSADANVYLLLVGIALILIAGVVALIWTYHSRLAGQSLLLALLLLFSFFSWGKAWELGHTHQNDPRQLWVTEGTASGVKALVDQLNASSRTATGTMHDISLTVAADGPVLRWYLRDFTHITWVDAVRPDAIAQAVITSGDDDQPLLGDSYLGTDFPILAQEPAEPAAQRVGSTLRWLLHRQAPLPQQAGWVVLWLRQDVALIGG